MLWCQSLITAYASAKKPKNIIRQIRLSRVYTDVYISVDPAQSTTDISLYLSAT